MAIFNSYVKLPEGNWDAIFRKKDPTAQLSVDSWKMSPQATYRWIA
jgi:hypothetical protein